MSNEEAAMNGEAANSEASSQSPTSRHLHNLQAQVDNLTVDVCQLMDHFKRHQDNAKESVSFQESFNRDITSQLLDWEGTFDTLFQRIRMTEDCIMVLERRNLETRLQILEATCEQVTIRVAHLTNRIAEIDRLLRVNQTH